MEKKNNEHLFLETISVGYLLLAIVIVDVNVIVGKKGVQCF